ncbi:MAG: hypothetical protein GF421_12510 [Candidatus Aminicenantes bacterium]|nr:hypothetical protein [Candidatus Aminicenantes bacterium]
MQTKSVSRFEKSRHLASLVSKDYAKDFFKLLVIYKDVSASEAAARLGLHIKTSQDFLEGLEKQDILEKKEAAEGKRPYFRYSLKRKKIQLTIDLDDLYDPEARSSQKNWKIKERRSSGAIFREGRSEKISVVLVFQGEGRSREQRRYNLTECQGRFLFHLPFPTEEPSSVQEISLKAGLSDDCLPEVLDMVDILISEGVIQKI